MFSINAMRSIEVIIFLISNAIVKHHCHALHRHSHLAKLQSQKSIFIKINTESKTVINDIFDSLKLPETFLREPNIKQLLTMNYDLNNMALKNEEMYDVLRNASNIELEWDNKKLLYKRLDKIVGKIIHERYFNHYKIQLKSIKRKLQTTHSANNKLLPKQKENIEEFKIQETKTSADNLTQENLEVWKPPPSIERNSSKNSIESRRIFGGQRTQVKDYPFIVAIQLADTFVCAGSIISADLIITAASCLQINYNNRFYREHPKITYVRIGSDYATIRGDLVPVVEIYFHPSYNPQTLENNLAIVRLERIIKFKSRAQRIDLDNGGGSFPINYDKITTLGWGAQNAYQAPHIFKKLSVIDLDVYHLEECKLVYTNYHVTDSNFCAGFLSKPGGACNKDLGGPGVVGSLLVGVISFGAPVCGTFDTPTVFVWVGRYINWINSILEMPRLKYGVRTTTRTPRSGLSFPIEKETVTKRKHLTPFTTISSVEEREETENALRDIISDLEGKNESTALDIINNDLDSDFSEIHSSKEPEDIFSHPLINKTFYLMPGIHFTPENEIILPGAAATTFEFNFTGTGTTFALWPWPHFRLESTTVVPHVKKKKSNKSSASSSEITGTEDDVSKFNKAENSMLRMNKTLYEVKDSSSTLSDTTSEEEEEEGIGIEFTTTTSTTEKITELQLRMANESDETEDDSNGSSSNYESLSSDSLADSIYW